MRFASNSGMQSSWQRRRGAGLVILALAAMLCGVPRVTARPSWQDSSTKAALQTAQDKKGKADAQKQARKERAAEEANQLPAVLWHDPGDIASRDMIGEGGAADAPDPHADYIFIKEDMNGTSPKFYARDPEGVEWLVKIGVEAKPETAAARFVWAMGYFTDEDFFLPQIHVIGLQKLRRKMIGVSLETGMVLNVRLKRQGPTLKNVENWDWRNNPFAGTRELRGLLVIMALMNNWDLKKDNNKVYVADGERHFLVSDLGASFGKTAAPPTHIPFIPHATKGVLKDYRNSRLIRSVSGDSVTFEMRTAVPFFMRPFGRKYFGEYVQAQRDEEGIPVDAVRWIGALLARLTPRQIEDAFRAAGYGPNDVQGFAAVVEQRITQLNHVEPQQIQGQEGPRIRR